MPFIHAKIYPSTFTQPLTHFIYLPTPHLKLLLTRPGHNDIVNLEHHAAQLGCQHQLLLLADERINDKRLLHVVLASTHSVDTDTATGGRILDLLALDFGQGGNGVQTAVLGQSHRNGVESLSERAHRVLFQAGSLDSRVLDGQAAGDLGRAAAIDNAVVAHQVSHNAESIVQRALGFVDDL